MDAKPRSHWEEIGRNAAEQAKNVNTGAAEFMNIMQEHLLRANAEVLKGLLRAIEDRLHKTQQQVAAVEKIPVTSAAADVSPSVIPTGIKIETEPVSPAPGATKS